jgi:pilus assembly protein Flp/PilA
MESMNKVYVAIASFFAGMYERDEAQDRGAGIVEYGLLVAFIALVALAGITLLGDNLSDFFTDIANNF